MNAAVADIDIPRARRRIDNRDRNWVESGLERWGAWVHDHMHYEGYPRADAVASYVYGGGGGPGGHRVLCDDMPKVIRFWHALVLMLPDHEHAVVKAHYVPKCKEDEQGRPTTLHWTGDEKAEKLGISPEAFRKRLSRARERIIDWSKQFPHA
jgi:hypothetical protein